MAFCGVPLFFCFRKKKGGAFPSPVDHWFFCLFDDYRYHTKAILAYQSFLSTGIGSIHTFSIFLYTRRIIYPLVATYRPSSDPKHTTPSGCTYI